VLDRDQPLIVFKRGNIFEESVDALVNPINCVGVSGKGLALEFKKRWPAIYEIYRAAAVRGKIRPGHVFTVTDHTIHGEGYPNGFLAIIHFPTKRHWRMKSLPEDIELGLGALAQEVVRLRLTSIAIPALGCGNGGLPWSWVREQIVQTFRYFDNVNVVVFEPMEN
jgi:O-acetyl-ADP-ribose deacetylase (regulator of RNase III)